MRVRPPQEITRRPPPRGLRFTCQKSYSQPDCLVHHGQVPVRPGGRLGGVRDAHAHALHLAGAPARGAVDLEHRVVRVRVVHRVLPVGCRARHARPEVGGRTPAGQAPYDRVRARIQARPARQALVERRVVRIRAPAGARPSAHAETAEALAHARRRTAGGVRALVAEQDHQPGPGPAAAARARLGTRTLRTLRLLRPVGCAPRSRDGARPGARRSRCVPGGARPRVPRRPGRRCAPPRARTPACGARRPARGGGQRPSEGRERREHGKEPL